jgi:ribonuclease J
MNEQKERDLKVITLSGVEVIGRNSYVVQYKDDIYVVDYGLTFPDGEGYGVDYLLPDYHWLQKNKDHIKGIIVTHAHLDHVGGLPFVIEQLGFPPIYASPFAIEFIREKFKEHGLHKKTQFFPVSEQDVIRKGPVSISFFHVTHSIPQCYGVCFETPEGRVVYTGDYKFDDHPLNEKPSNYKKIEEIGKKGVLVALLDSTNAFEAGKSKSETEILGVLEDVILKAEGRVIIATFSSLVTRIAGLIEVARKHGKKILFTGRSLENNMKIAMRIGYVTPEANLVISPKEAHKIPDNQLIIVTTGSQGEPMAALTRMAFNKHDVITIKKTDTVIISSSVIPTNTLDVQRLLDEISRKGARIINSKLMDIHVSGHAYQEDMKRMAQLLNAKYFIPVHGYASFLSQHKLVLKEIGVPESNVLIPVEGAVYSFKGGQVLQEKKLKVQPAAVVGEKILEKGEPLIAERKILSTNGICHVAFIQKGEELTKTNILLRGFDMSKETEAIIVDLEKKILHWYSVLTDKPRLKKYMYAKLGAYFMKYYGETPLLSIDVVNI